ncbi:hypothetical protein HMPREF9004_0302 [Schaalia cardiffensis F0333]|uniref:Uncharacterized protein n=1 Tax=Schaalia cardiffensis F0333 TaxID=888050 RepID=N6X6G0_9ACTO|nr:hypothetical protein HMPREF9004_0302 [Schaalia cardiffensis F0333]
MVMRKGYVNLWLSVAFEALCSSPLGFLARYSAPSTRKLSPQYAERKRGRRHDPWRRAP